MATTSNLMPNGVAVSTPSHQSPQAQPTQAPSPTAQNSQATGDSAASSATAVAQSSPPQTQQVATASGVVAGSSTPNHAPRPRDARTLELLLTSQGVTSWDSRVPLLLLDFAYRHTQAVLSDAIHLTTDPYTSQAGAKPSGTSGVLPTAPSGSDAAISNNAINIAVAARQTYQFRSSSGRGGGGGAGGASKDWLQEIAKERNRVALPRVTAPQWGIRLPTERFVLSGVGFGLRKMWDEGGMADEEEDEGEMEDDAMEGVMDGSDNGGKAGEDAAEAGGGLDEYLGDEMEEDEDMEDVE